MKFKNIGIIFIIVLLCSCSNKKKGYFKHEKINIIFYVQDVYRAKYSKIKGYIVYNNIKVSIDNGNSEYYKYYNLKKGDNINTSIDIFYYSTNYGYELIFGDVNVSHYEHNKKI